MIELQAISKTYARSTQKAVDNLSLTIGAGQIFGFLGPNGAGKTSTIKMMCGVLVPDNGSILMDGIDLKTNPVEARRTFAWVPDIPDLFPRLSGMEYLNFIGDVYDVSTTDRRARIAEYAGLLEIDSVLAARISSYSHGMKQKLLAVASLLHDPSNWILDEPLTGLDPAGAFNIKELMRQRAAAGKTVFFSTHIMEVAEKLCDQIGIIRKGQLVFTGTVEELRMQSGSDQSLEQLFLDLVETAPSPLFPTEKSR